MNLPVIVPIRMPIEMPMGKVTTKIVFSDYSNTQWEETEHQWDRCWIALSRRQLRDLGATGVDYRQELKLGVVAQLGPYRVRYCWHEDGYGPLWLADGWRAKRTAVYAHIWRGIRGLELRLVLTLHVWGLAYYPEYDPAWKYIKLVRWVEKKFKHQTGDIEV